MGRSVSFAQTPVSQFLATYVPASSAVGNYNALPNNPGTFTGCSGTNNNYTWSNGSSNQLKLLSFTANAKSYIVTGAPGVQVKLRRVNNANVTGNRSILYSETTATTANACPTVTQLNFKAPYNDDMSTFLNNNVLNHGTDNIFTNSGNGDGNNNNIERVDVIFPSGISASNAAEAGFILCERGAANAHDGFRIAAILTKDGSNDPTSFGAVKTCVAGNGSNNGSWGHPTTGSGGNRQLAAYVLRKEAAESYLRVSSNVNQEIGGVFFSLADLGVAAHQIIYGYSLLGPDGTANPSSAQLLNINDAAVYPTSTTEVQGGGLDLISVNTFFMNDVLLAVSPVKFFTGAVQQDQALLNWELQSLPANSQITLERSDNALNYTAIYTYTYGDLPDSKRFFSNKISSGVYYYRLRIQSASGASTFSNTITLQITPGTDWKIYPTVLTNNQNITIEGLSDGNYDAVLQSMTSRTGKINFTSTGGRTTITLSRKTLASGTYLLLIEKNGRRTGKSNKIIIQNF